MKWHFLNIKYNHDCDLLELGSDASTASDVNGYAAMTQCFWKCEVVFCP
jgi:hypothetical protein